MEPHLLTVEPAPLPDATLLRLWDVAGPLAPAARSREILRLCLPEQAFSQVLQAPLGHAHIALLRIRLKRFGSALHLLDRCPYCTEPIEFTIAAETLLDGLHAPAPDDRREVRLESWTLHLRPLALSDLLATPPDLSPEESGRRLMARTVLAISRDGQPAEVRDLPGEAWEAVAQAQHDWDPAAEILFALNCPACHRAWESPLDPGAYLWLELAAQARTLEGQVHTLASAYGWRESEILELSPARRAAYVGLILNGPHAALTPLPRPRPARQLPA